MGRLAWSKVPVTNFIGIGGVLVGLCTSMHHLGETPMLTTDHKVRTLQLEQHALAGCDLCAGLAQTLEHQRDLVAARHAVREDLHVMPTFEQVQGGLQHTYMRLRSGTSSD
jgi:hypothetical protein